MHTNRLLTASLALTFAAASNAQTHVYVDDDAPPGGDGLSWQTAFNDLHDAIDLAKTLGQNRGEIRIAGGTYNAGNNPFEVPLATPELRPMRLLGAFAGLSNPLNPNERDTDLYASFLDADNNTSVIVLTSAVTLSPGATVRPAYVAPTSATTLENLSFRNTFAASIFNTDRFLTVRIHDCEFVGLKNSYDRAIMLTDLDVLIDQSLFALNTPQTATSFGGGAIQLSGGISTIRACDFISNRTSGQPGGAIRLLDGEHAVIGCVFAGNTANRDGGAISVEYGSVLITGTEFYDNNSSSSGRGGAAAIVVSDPTIQSQIDRCVFIANSASRGGALLLNNQGDPEDSLVLSASTFVQCEATMTGGAVSVDPNSGRVRITHVDFNENKAAYGGGLFGGANVEHSLFEGNDAQFDGGGFYGSSRSTVENSDFINCFAGISGGGTYAVSAITLTNFNGNYAGQGGGAVFGAERLISVTAIGNQTGSNGSTVSSVSEVHRTIVKSNQGHGLQGPIKIINQCEISNNQGDGIRCGLLSPDSVLEIVSSVINNNTELGMRVSTSAAGSYVYLEDVSVADNGISGIDIMSSGDVQIDAHRVVVAGNERDTILVSQGAPSQRASLSIYDSLLHSVSRPALDIPNRVDVLLAGVTAISEADAAVSATIDSTLQVESSVLMKGDAPSTIVFLGTDLVLIQSLIEGGISAVLSPPIQPKIVGEILDADPGFVSPGGIDGDSATWKDNDYRPRPGSVLIDNGSSLGSIIGRELDLAGMSRIVDDTGIPNGGFGIHRTIDLGAYEFQGTTCSPDINNDGRVSPADFSAWVAAFNNGSRRADQNFDGVVAPSDFSAWISNYNTGCP
ncbi:MAG: right-handed parallel beta-helix repeat-containing protein [Phycisphaerales bacterium]|nr:right-handed parallel beta-helix repeat-containing protein [Phycisphaerales bacterium]MCB9835751.1 right-handed parallel beta-helix repeat-containing protein [Phycisphaera sp.]